jgi:UDP-N-acetylglucosamine 2-epimerase (non-hydrolysing)
MIKNLIVFGTRPEAIKMASLVKKFLLNKNFQTKVCVTAQHREMLDQVLEFFEITPDYDLNLMKRDQNLFSLTSDIITELKPVLEDFQPDFVYVHGDTTTSMAVSLAAFYSGSKVCHVEAGLRTNNKLSPFPEEMNRQITGRIADFHFSPTEESKNNLLQENIKPETILVTGNTVIDALLYSKDKLSNYTNDEIKDLGDTINFSKKIILVTGHRRENHGEGIKNICEALLEIASKYDEEVEIVYPVHLNPNIQEPVNKYLGNTSNIKLVSPLSYPSFVWLMNQSYLILTDSGGVQEEAPSLGKPVLVLRETTERPEAVSAGTVILIGTNKKDIISSCLELLENNVKYLEMTKAHNPYGDGFASDRIIEFIEKQDII